MTDLDLNIALIYWSYFSDVQENIYVSNMKQAIIIPNPHVIVAHERRVVV
jgi:hypothetical protein